MNSLAFAFAAALIAAALGSQPACAADGAEILGTGLGMAAGGLLGSQIGKGSGNVISTGVGIAVGGVVGNAIVRDLDTPAAAPAPSYVQPGQPAPIVYNSYQPNYVAPPAPPPQVQPTTYVDKNTYCRPFSQEIKIDGQVQESFGTACLQPDGTWRVVP